jgi:hypothetical protein
MQEIYMKCVKKRYTDARQGSGHEIYAEVEPESAELDEPRAKMMFLHRHFNREIGRVILHMFELDLLFCREVGTVFITDFYGNELYADDLYPQELRPHYNWIWKQNYMRRLKSMLSRVVYKLYGLKCQFYNKGAFNIAKTNAKQVLLNQVIPFGNQLPSGCLVNICRNLIPRWFQYEHVPVAGRWSHMQQSAFLMRRRIFNFERKALTYMEQYSPSPPPMDANYILNWETTQLVFL